MKVEIEHEGSFVLFTPLDADAREWFEDNVSSEPWQWLGAALAVDHRMARDLILAMEERKSA